MFYLLLQGTVATELQIKQTVKLSGVEDLCLNNRKKQRKVCEFAAFLKLSLKKIFIVNCLHSEVSSSLLPM